MVFPAMRYINALTVGVAERRRVRDVEKDPEGGGGVNHEAECDDGIPTSLDDVRAEDAEDQSAQKLSQADKDAVHSDLHAWASFKTFFLKAAVLKFFKICIGVIHLKFSTELSKKN